MPEIKIDKNRLDEMLAEVADQLKNDLEQMTKSEVLAKAMPGDEPPDEASEGSSGPSDPVPGDIEADMSAPADSAPPAAPMPGEASASPNPMEASPEAPMGDEAGEIEAQATPEALQAEYAKLPPDQLEMHLQAAMAAKQMLMGGQGQGQAPMAPPAPAPQAPMAMSEGNPNGGEIKVAKSESIDELAFLKDKLAKQADETKTLEELVGKLCEVVAAPMRKSVKGLSDLQFVAKTDEDKISPAQELTKTEVIGKLRTKARDASLSKSDRDLISQYSVGKVDVSKIEHLLISAK